MFGAYIATLLVFVDRFLGLSYQMNVVSNVAKGLAGLAGSGACISLFWPEFGGFLMRFVALVLVFGAPLVLLRLSGAGVSRARHMLPAIGVLSVSGICAGMFALGWFPYQLWTPLFLTAYKSWRQCSWCKPSCAKWIGDYWATPRPLKHLPIQLTKWGWPQSELREDEQGREEAGVQVPQPITQTREESALAGSQLGIWDWNIRDDELYVSPFIEAALGLPQGALNGPELAWRECMAPG